MSPMVKNFYRISNRRRELILRCWENYLCSDFELNILDAEAGRFSVFSFQFILPSKVLCDKFLVHKFIIMIAKSPPRQRDKLIHVRILAGRWQSVWCHFDLFSFSFLFCFLGCCCFQLKRGMRVGQKCYSNFYACTANDQHVEHWALGSY